MSFAQNMGTAETAGGGEPVPAGEYLLFVEGAELRQNKSSQGSHVWIQCKVSRGQHEGRAVFQRYTYEHGNETAQNIGRSQFKALCLACGLRVEGEGGSRVVIDDRTGQPITGPQCLIGREFIGTVAIERREGYDPQNIIKGAAPARSAPSGNAGGYADTDVGF